MKRVIIGAIVSLACLQASAEFFSGNRLLALMRGDNMDQAHAMGYVVGAADAMNGVMWCPPAAITTGQVYDMTRAILESTPSERHISADVFVRAALNRAFPCKQQKQGGREA